VSVAVKICGITRPEDAAVAAELGASYIGLNFWSGSRRRVSIEQARVVAAAAPPGVLVVGVFVNATGDEIEDTARRVGLDLVQLHGDEEPQACERFAGRYIRALRADLAATAPRYPGAVAILVDTPSSTYGGTGRTFDWAEAQPARVAGKPLILAGGLHPGNVVAAVRAVRPEGVDVASGVESSPGIKDHGMMRDFMSAVRESTP
jgi:phosphoribosylanthranilate isomerase